MNQKIGAAMVVTVFFITVFTGCFEAECPDPSENKPILIGCILRHPGKYLNETVIIKGDFGTAQNDTWVETPSISFGSVPDGIDITFTEQVNTSLLTPWKLYYFTGIVRKFEQSDMGFHPYFLEVFNVEEV